MIRRFLFSLLILSVSLLAAEKRYYLNYYSFGDPLQLALDYAFSTAGYRFTAHPDLLSRPWYGQFKGYVTADQLPRYVESVLSPLGLRVDLGAESVYIVHEAEPTGVYQLVDTTLALDSSLAEYVSQWCNAPVCSSVKLPNNMFWIRSLPDFFVSVVRPLSGFLEPTALDPDDDLEAHILLVRYSFDTTLTLGISYPETYLPAPDVLHNIHALYSGLSYSIEARPRLHITAGRAQSVFIGQEREVPKNILTESGAVVQEKTYRRYGLTIDITSGKKDHFDHYPFSLRISSTDYQENGTALISESSSDFVLPLDSAIIVAGVQSQSRYKERVGVPFLCQIPVLGFLFGRDVDRAERVQYDVIFWINRRNSASAADSLTH